GVVANVVDVELDICGSKGLAIGPLHAPAQVEGEGAAVLGDLVGLGDVGEDLLPVDRPGDEVVIVDGAFQPGGVLAADEGGAPGATVGADGVDGSDDEGLLADALGDGGQILVGEEGGLGELGRDRGGLGDRVAAAGGGGDGEAHRPAHLQKPTAGERR